MIRVKTGVGVSVRVRVSVSVRVRVRVGEIVSTLTLLRHIEIQKSGFGTT